MKMIVEKELSVSNRKKVDIVSDLRKRGFTPFAKKSKAKEAGETQPVVEEEQEEDDAAIAAGLTDFDYLLGMAISSLTKEKASIGHRESNQTHAHCRDSDGEAQGRGASEGRRVEGFLAHHSIGNVG